MSLPISGDGILPKQLNAGHMYPFTLNALNPSKVPATPNALLGTVTGLFIVDLPTEATTKDTGPTFQPTNNISITDVYMRSSAATAGQVSVSKLNTAGVATQITVLTFATHAIGEIVRASQIAATIIAGFSAGDRIVAFSSGGLTELGVQVFIEFNNYEVIQ